MHENNGDGLTIIVVEDCDDIRRMLRIKLQRRGYLVLEAENGQVAVELVKQKCPDLILMDLHMPVLDGLAATRILREHEELSQIPIIAISACPEENGQAQSRAAGCSGYLSKPVDFMVLDYLMTSLLAA
jgi:two-component system cell cycle response regulator DivK